MPKNASVSNFSMWINGKEMIGEVVEKQRARQIYESYKQTRRDPGLLEQVDYKRFEMRIFPIAAGAEQRVRIAYYQESRFRSRPRQLHLSVGHADVRRDRREDHGAVLVLAGREERGADRRPEQPFARGSVRDRQARGRALPAGQPGEQRRQLGARSGSELRAGAACAPAWI